MSTITKEYIKATLLRMYQETGIIPKSKTKISEFSLSTVRNKFGTWNNALIESGVPVRIVNLSKEIQCTQCNVNFMKLTNQIEKYTNHFCSRSCSATYRNTNRIVSEETKLKTQLALKKFNKINPDANKKFHKLNPDANKKYSDDQVKVVNGRRHIIKTKECVVCKIDFNAHFENKTCSDKCLKIRQIQAGMNSQKANPRRSKGEILFFNLCSKYFGKDNVLSNPQIFVDKNGNKWDADICIPKCKLAICYNGIWHYEQIGKKHNLKQVQSRDLIKKSIIHNNGYIQYIVKDMGKFDELFVYQQFHQFIFQFLIHLELKMNIDF